MVNAATPAMPARARRAQVWPACRAYCGSGRIGLTRGGGRRKSQPGKFVASSQFASATSSIAVRPPGDLRGKVNSFGRGLRDFVTGDPGVGPT